PSPMAKSIWRFAQARNRVGIAAARYQLRRSDCSGRESYQNRSSRNAGNISWLKISGRGRNLGAHAARTAMVNVALITALRVRHNPNAKMIKLISATTILISTAGPKDGLTL